MSELNRMSLPADLLRTKKLEDLKYLNDCGDNLFKDEMIMDIDNQFEKLPAFLTTKKMPKKSD